MHVMCRVFKHVQFITFPNMHSSYRKPHKANSTSEGNEVIDVEEYLKRFEDSESLVQCSTAEEFRKGWRAMYKDGSKSRNNSVEVSAQSQTHTRGQSRSQGQGGKGQARDNIRTLASARSKERQPPPPSLAKRAPISAPHPNSSTRPPKRPRIDLEPIDASSSTLTKTRTQRRSTRSAASSSLVDLSTTPPDRQGRSYRARTSRSPSASASA